MSSSISKLVFKDNLIKDRSELIIICIEVCRALQETTPDDIVKYEFNKIIVHNSKMCRLFFFSEKKYISISCPLTIMTQPDGKPIFKYKDTFMTSNLWSWINTSYNSFKNNISDLEDLLFSNELAKEAGIDNFEEIFYGFVNADYGYLRYDVDKATFKKAKEKGFCHKHPEHHCDIHLDSKASFKAGLIGKITPEEFINILDNEEDRWYLCKHKDVPKAKSL